MSKRKDARTRRRTRGTSKRPERTEARIAEVKTWLQRMDDHSARAISLSERMSSADTDQSNRPLRGACEVRGKGIGSLVVHSSYADLCGSKSNMQMLLNNLRRTDVRKEADDVLVR